jgi:hypothetical protein
MATAPGITSGSFSPKSFWQRPEGFPGKVLTAVAIAAGVYGLYLALPILTSVVWGTVNLAIGVAVLAVLGYIVTNGTVQCLAKNIFQSICRGIASFYTTIDPIGILKNYLDDMRKGKEKLSATIKSLAGSDGILRRKIADRQEQAKQLMAEANSARAMAAKSTNQLEQQRLLMKAQTNEQKTGFLLGGGEQLTALEKQTADLLDKFRRWEVATDAKIERTEFQVDYWSDQRQVVLASQRALGIATRLLKGDPEQMKLVNGAIDYMIEDAARTAGEIEDFDRFAEKMLTDIDVENTANAERARAKFAEFSQKLDEDAARPTAADQLQAAIAGAVASPGFNPTPMARGTAASGGGDYSDLFKK